MDTALRPAELATRVTGMLAVGVHEGAPRRGTPAAELDVASKVAQESPELYFEIQSLNDYGAESLEALAQAVERLRKAVISQDFAEFESLMRRGREYLEDRRSVTERRA